MRRCLFVATGACVLLGLTGASAVADPSGAAGAPPAAANALPATDMAPSIAPAPTSTAPMAGAAQTTPSEAVVVYIDPAITSRKWSNQSALFRLVFLLGSLNDVGQELNSRITKLVTSLAPNATVVTSPAPAGGAKFYIVPTIKRLEQISGVFAWDDLSYVMELEWRVTDGQGNVVLLDTVKGEGKGKFGTSFSASGNATRYEYAMLDQVMSESEALLKPVLTQAASH